MIIGKQAEKKTMITYEQTVNIAFTICILVYLVAINVDPLTGNALLDNRVIIGFFLTTLFVYLMFTGTKECNDLDQLDDKNRSEQG
jgi:hypothetical protein